MKKKNWLKIWENFFVLCGVPAVGDSNSQWHEKSSKKCQLVEVPVGRGASWGNCQLGEVPVWGLVPVGGQNLTFGRAIFF